MLMATMFDQLQLMIRDEIPHPPAAASIGVRFQVVEPNYAVLTLQAAPNHMNPNGTLAGGILSTLADMAMAVAHDTTLAAGEFGTTLEFKINFTKPVHEGTQLQATGRIISKGRTIGVATCDVHNENDELVAHATGTFMVLHRKPRPTPPSPATAPT